MRDLKDLKYRTGNSPSHAIYLKMRDLSQYSEFKKLSVWSFVSSAVYVAQQILADAETKRPVVHNNFVCS